MRKRSTALFAVLLRVVQSWTLPPSPVLPQPISSSLEGGQLYGTDEACSLTRHERSISPAFALAQLFSPQVNIPYIKEEKFSDSLGLTGIGLQISRDELQ
ncbi:hypothetical protein [Paenibacillus sp. UNC496MF]|uniref:hypothetical protein n=1 Tax=Paenibacillus sp. UNC496MF TaxID=1502753 RepID=UPI001C4308F3|nr:hypothetical protein [Paenibacillus sp. UNC496MF]